jgi:hypothetical protein
VETAGQLIRAGANLNAANDHGVTPLMLACENASPEMAGALLVVPAVNAVQKNGVTPLMMAARTARGRGPAADRAGRTRERRDAVNRSDRTDVGDCRTSSGRHATAPRCRRRRARALEDRVHAAHVRGAQR